MCTDIHHLGYIHTYKCVQTYTTSMNPTAAFSEFVAAVLQCVQRAFVTALLQYVQYAFICIRVCSVCIHTHIYMCIYKLHLHASDTSVLRVRDGFVAVCLVCVHIYIHIYIYMCINMHHFGESNSSLLKLCEGGVAAYLVCIHTYIQASCVYVSQASLQ